MVWYHVRLICRHFVDCIRDLAYAHSNLQSVTDILTDDLQIILDELISKSSTGNPIMGELSSINVSTEIVLSNLSDKFFSIILEFGLDNREDECFFDVKEMLEAVIKVLTSVWSDRMNTVVRCKITQSLIRNFEEYIKRWSSTFKNKYLMLSKKLANRLHETTKFTSEHADVYSMSEDWYELRHYFSTADLCFHVNNYLDRFEDSARDMI